MSILSPTNTFPLTATSLLKVGPDSECVVPVSLSYIYFMEFLSFTVQSIDAEKLKTKSGLMSAEMPGRNFILIFASGILPAIFPVTETDADVSCSKEMVTFW